MNTSSILFTNKTTMEEAQTPKNATHVPKKRRRLRCVYSKEKTTKKRCKFCGKRLTSKALATHYESAHGDSVWQCTICEKGFTRAANVKQHIKKQHPGMDQEWFQKMKKEELPMHVLEAMRSRARSEIVISSFAPRITKFNCYDCDASFPSVAELFTHCETHRVSETGEKFPYLIKTAKRWSELANRWVYK